MKEKKNDITKENQKDRHSEIKRSITAEITK